MIRDQFTLDVHNELIIDNFAGGGGASTGIEMALGRWVDVAINHDSEAVQMHAINHPQTKHYCESVWDVDPLEVTQGQPLLWRGSRPTASTSARPRAAAGREEDSRPRLDRAALVGAFLAQHFGGHYDGPGAPLDAPTHTVTAVDHHALVTAQLVGCSGRAGQSRPRNANEPVQTITAKGDTAIVASTLAKLRNNQFAQDTREPAPTLTAGGHIADVRAFLVKSYGECGQDQDARDPMHTIPTKDHLGLVTVAGTQNAIADIGMRMLEPHELYAAQGFPASYVIAPTINGASGEACRGADVRQQRLPAARRSTGASQCF